MFGNLYRKAGVRYSQIFMGAGTSEDEYTRAKIMFALSAFYFVFSGVVSGMFDPHSAMAASDLNAIGSNVQSEASSVTKGMYYGIGGLGLATSAGGILHIKNAHKQERSVAPGVTALLAGSAMTGIGTYQAVVNQSAVQNSGTMSTSAMGVPQ